MAPPTLVLITLTSGRCDVAYWHFSDLNVQGEDVRLRGHSGLRFRARLSPLRTLNGSRPHGNGASSRVPFRLSTVGRYRTPFVGSDASRVGTSVRGNVVNLAAR